MDTDVVSASFPCVDVSRLGSRAGIDGAETGLVRHVFRLLGDPLGPRVPWVLLENVPGLLDRSVGGDGAPAIAYVVSELERLGYAWAHRCLTAQSFGIPQRRRRVFIVASRTGADPRDVLFGHQFFCMGGCREAFGAPCLECAFNQPSADVPGDGSPSQPSADTDGLLSQPSASDLADNVPTQLSAPVVADSAAPNDAQRDDTLGAVRKAPSGHAAALALGVAVDLSNAQNAPVTGLVPTFTTGNCRMGVLLPDGSFGLLRISDAERLQGLPVGWTAPGALLGSRGASASREGAERRFDVAVRWGLLGNAVCVPVARWLGERLRSPCSAKYVTRGAVSSTPFSSPVPPGMWPRDAWRVPGCGNGERHSVGDSAPAPIYVPFVPLGDFVRAVGPPPSAEACEVWVGRMRTAGWTLGGPLKEAMEAILRAPGGAGAPAGVATDRGVFIKEPLLRRAVWARCRSAPVAWPGLVADVDRDTVPKRCLEHRSRGPDSLLVVFHGDATWHWVSPEACEDFAAGFAQKANVDAGRSRALFHAAVTEARALWEKRTAAEAGRGATLGPLPLAPTAAHMAEPCGACRPCRGGAGRGCLMKDARRLAVAGHVGSSITLLGLAARGRRCDVYWPLDSRYYSATVMDFEPSGCRHRLLYDDDACEWVSLFKETVALHSIPEPPPDSLTGRGEDTAAVPAPRLTTERRAAPSILPRSPEAASVPVAATPEARAPPVMEDSPEQEPRPKRHRTGPAIDYAALLAPEPRVSTRCGECKKQKKGQCGTATASRLCTRRAEEDEPLPSWGPLAMSRLAPAAAVP